jgi:hypothetical protein
MSTTIRRAFAVSALCATMSGCVGPVRTFRVYAQKAADTAQQVSSALQTAIVAGEVVGRGDATATFVAVVVANAEDDASSAQSTFDSLQPPDARAIAVRSALDDLLTSSLDALSSIRIAARLGRADRVPALASRLPPLVQRLDDFRQRYA